MAFLRLKARANRFLDPSAMHQMLVREDGLWRFAGLLNLAATGHMKCNPLEDSDKQLPYWVTPVQVLEELLLKLSK